MVKLRMPPGKLQYLFFFSVAISNAVITVSLRQEEEEIMKMCSVTFCWKCFDTSKAMELHIFNAFVGDCTILPAVICLRTLSGMVQLVCVWVISCPWMKSSVVNEWHRLNSPSLRWREETKRNGTITRLRGNKCLSLGSNSFPVQHTEALTNYLLPTG